MLNNSLNKAFFGRGWAELSFKAWARVVRDSRTGTELRAVLPVRRRAELLLPIARQWQPQLVLVSAGFDSAAGDETRFMARVYTALLPACYDAQCPCPRYLSTFSAVRIRICPSQQTCPVACVAWRAFLVHTFR